MKKSTILIALAAVAGMFTSCSKDSENLGPDVIDDAAKQEIVLQVSNGGDALTATRAGRPLYSSEAKQDIDNVVVLITKGNVVERKMVVENWKTASGAYITNGHGRERILAIDPKLEPGDYVVYAYGYSNTTDYELPAVDKGATFEPNTILKLKNACVGEEIFAGSINLNVVAGEGFRPDLVLHRQVAGVFTYLKSIPFYQDGEGAGVKKGTRLRLFASAKRESLVLGNFVTKEVANNGNNASVSNVINGTSTGAAQVNGETLIYEIDLNKWFGDNFVDADNDKLIDVASWKNPYQAAGAAFAEGSVFGGTFLIPFEAVDAKNTLVLKMTDETGERVFQTWVIKLAGATAAEGSLWDGSKFTPKTFAQDANVYSIFRNQLYGVGTKVKDSEVTPGPDPDPDTPIDINKKHELTLRVNDNWEAIHEMEIE